MNNNNNTVWILIVVILAFFLFVMPFGTGRWGGFCGMMGNYSTTNYGYGMTGGFGWIFMLVVLVALILFIVWLINELQVKPHKNRRK